MARVGMSKARAKALERRARQEAQASRGAIADRYKGGATPFDWGGPSAGPDDPVWESTIPRGVSFMQPVPSLIVGGYRPVELFAVGTSYRGPLALHAATRWQPEQRAVCNREPIRTALRAMGHDGVHPLPLGAFLGTVELADCILINDNEDDEVIHDCRPIRYFEGRSFRLRYEWHFRYVRRIPVPIPTHDHNKKSNTYKPCKSFDNLITLGVFPVLPAHEWAAIIGAANPVRMPEPIDKSLCVYQLVWDQLRLIREAAGVL